MTPPLASYTPTGYLMIHETEIRNFKCFEHLHIKGCRRINIIVGENGVGKTALLEGMFFAAGTTSELIIRYRQQRGLDGTFRGSARAIGNALMLDLFYMLRTNESISVVNTGTDKHTRSGQIIRNDDVPAGFMIIWTDSKGRDHPIIPQISGAGLQFPETGEETSDVFYFAANQTHPSIENAERFSILSRQKRQNDFIKAFTHEYAWLEGFTNEITAGSTAIYASVEGLSDKIPLANVSGGLNRFASIIVALQTAPKCVAFVDEVENGLYYKHHKHFWETLLATSRSNDSQLFLTTHSDEWLQSLLLAAKDNFEDISLWRIEKSKANRPVLHQFNGKQVRAGIKAGGMR